MAVAAQRGIRLHPEGTACRDEAAPRSYHRVVYPHVIEGLGECASVLGVAATFKALDWQWEKAGRKKVRGKSPPPSKRRVLGLLSGLLWSNPLSPVYVRFGGEHVAFQCSGQLRVPLVAYN